MIHRFTRDQGAVLVIDLQERLAAAMDATRLRQVMARAGAAIEGAKALGLPVVVTEQYPIGLGPTLRALSERVPGFSPVEKTQFSALLPATREQLAGRTQILVMGMETHICVLQTVRALAGAGLTPHLAADAVLSRTAIDQHTGVELCRSAGAQITTVETALFDALERSGGPEFKAISAAIRHLG